MAKSRRRDRSRETGRTRRDRRPRGRPSEPRTGRQARPSEHSERSEARSGARRSKPRQGDQSVDRREMPREGMLRERWAKPIDSSLAAIVVGIGALFWWLQPGAALQHNGLAFIVAWLVCLCLIGLPLWWLELSYGACLQASLTAALRRKARAWSWVGWWGHGLLFLSGALLTVVCTWLLVRGGSELGGLFTGQDTAPGAGSADHISWSSQFLAAVACLLVAAFFARSRLRVIGLSLRWGLGLGVLLALLSVAVLAYDPQARQGMLLVLQTDWSALLVLDTWVGAALHAAATAMIGTGCGEPNRDENAFSNGLCLFGEL